MLRDQVNNFLMVIFYGILLIAAATAWIAIWNFYPETAAGVFTFWVILWKAEDKT